MNLAARQIAYYNYTIGSGPGRGWLAAACRDIDTRTGQAAALELPPVSSRTAPTTARVGRGKRRSSPD